MKRKGKGYVRRFASYYRPHARLFVADIFCALLIALCNLFYPVVTRAIINDYVPNRELTQLIVWGVVLLAIYALKCFLTYFIQSWGHILGVRIQADMRRDMFRHLQRLPYAYFDAHKTGEIMSGVVNDLYEVGELAHHGPEDTFLSLVTIIGAFVMLMTINVYLTLIVFCVLPVVAVFASRSKKRMHDAFSAMRERTAKVNTDVSTTISGVRVTKAFGVEEYADKRFDGVNREFVVARGSAYKSMGVFYAGMGFISDFLYLTVLVAGGLFFFFGFIDTGDFAAYILYIAMLINPVKSLVNIYEQLQSGMTGFARFCAVMDEKPEEDAEGAVPMPAPVRDIRFDDVTFSYGGGEVLRGVSFIAECGKTTALVGGSGGGKTTVCMLLMRFYEPCGGRILIDGADIARYTRRSLRERVAIVAQDVFIFDGTVRENIAFGKLDATDEEIAAAAKSAGIHEYVSAQPDGYSSWVGERGLKLSGGQRQRVSIARAFLKNPEVLILDEATSALDNVTEAGILSALSELCIGRTVITVAHRLSTVRGADKIVVIEDGRVAEEGTHESLAAAGGIYAAMLAAPEERASGA